MKLIYTALGGAALAAAASLGVGTAFADATGYAELPANALSLLKLDKPFDQRNLQRVIAEALDADA